ncbi:MAG: haloacid dehalogenase-like hydrolase [Verrucomicrobia bacterium]|nr:haloacid dehalogenase-like hydrolase [Verrucomicrobiota bacterium]
MILLLWDIDGTLLASGGAGMVAMRLGLRDALGIDGSLDDIEFAGRTDRWIIRRIFDKFSVPHTAENYDRYVAGYIAALPGALRANPRARVLGGVRELLAAVAARPGVTQGVLTGNLRAGARAKLAHHGLWDYFPFGAFADDAELRNDLGPHALARARAHTGTTFAPARIWIIGDTPHDIACARAIGARVLAVATGSHSRDTLAAHAPDALLDDLADAAAFWKLIS